MMYRAIRASVVFGVIAIVGVAMGGSFLTDSISYAADLASADTAAASQALASDACALLTPAEIEKATGLKVGNGAAGPPIPGVLGKCTWTGGANTKVIVTLADARHMELTITAQQQTGGTQVPGLGSKAVGIEGAGFAGGGYIINVLDAKGGFGVSILGADGTRDRVAALAKIVASRR